MQAPAFTDDIVAKMFRKALEQAEAQNHHWDNLALFHFAALIARHYNLTAADVLDEICETPGHVLDNARCPQGLTAVASYLATTLGADGPPFLATVH